MMSTVKDFASFFRIYDWLKQWAADSGFPEDAGGFHGAIGAILGIQAKHGIPVLYVSQTEKRIRAVMLGWPTEGMRDGDTFPSLVVPCQSPCHLENIEGHQHHAPSAFFIKKMWISPRYAECKDFGFGEDILSIWPQTKFIIRFDSEGKLQELLSAEKKVQPDG